MFDTPFGKVGVLICLDVEHVDVLEATLALNPFMILNPVWIPYADNDTPSIESKMKWNCTGILMIDIN